MRCEICGAVEPDRYLRRTAEGYLCPDCLAPYIDERRERYTELFTEENQAGFLLTWFRCGDCIPPFDEQWWLSLLSTALTEHEKTHPGSAAALRREYAGDTGSDFEDFIIRQEENERHTSLAAGLGRAVGRREQKGFRHGEDPSPKV